MADSFIIATRGSKLALVQAEQVRDGLRRLEPESAVELLVIKTTGDRILDAPLAQIGGKGLFVKEIEEAVLAGRAQAAVHSVKDLPVDIPPGLGLAAVPGREDFRDVLVSRSGRGLMDLKPGARLGTSSLRRRAQVLALRPDLEVASIRGNVDTRLNKLAQGQFEALIMAAAGLKRLGREEAISHYLEPEVMLPAVGQGALGLECALADLEATGLLGRLNDEAASIEVRAERGFLARLEGGCQVPIACLARLSRTGLTVEGLVAGLDGRPLIRRRLTGPAGEAEELGRALAEEILGLGGRAILDEVYAR